eukprot:scaffold72229_cov63-Phaeocystis_antarctica.AAC.2
MDGGVASRDAGTVVVEGRTGGGAGEAGRTARATAGLARWVAGLAGHLPADHGDVGAVGALGDAARVGEEAKVARGTAREALVGSGAGAGATARVTRRAVRGDIGVLADGRAVREASVARLQRQHTLRVGHAGLGAVTEGEGRGAAHAISVRGARACAAARMAGHAGVGAGGRAARARVAWLDGAVRIAAVTRHLVAIVTPLGTYALRVATHATAHVLHVGCRHAGVAHLDAARAVAAVASCSVVVVASLQAASSHRDAIPAQRHAPVEPAHAAAACELRTAAACEAALDRAEGVASVAPHCVVVVARLRRGAYAVAADVHHGSDGDALRLAAVAVVVLLHGEVAHGERRAPVADDRGGHAEAQPAAAAAASP